MDFPSGIIVLNKPKGESSRATLNRLQRAVRSRCHQGGKPPRVGHAGTLDPLAEGVLVACVGEATKLIGVIQMLPKCYTGTFQLGVTSDTEDAESTIVPLPNPSQPTYDELQEATSRFTGRIQQRPPAFSALKIAGKRAYQLARQGEQFELASREIDIYQIDLVAYNYPIFRLKIECGSGTYVRSIGRDMGEAVGSGAIMTALTREYIGPFTLADSLSSRMFDDPQSDAWCKHLLPLEFGVSHLPRVDLDKKTTARLLMGQAVRHDEIHFMQKTSVNFSLEETNLCAAFSPQNQLVSLLELVDGKYVKIKKNFAVHLIHRTDSPSAIANLSVNLMENK
ncbi:MAG: tRNA pseudouridine(55) synthase TruB [Planctomycetaceae bacterium]|nr:tRNA pseudouridine(55) synthase TruB [Planctomycetaceae bacterium]